MAIAVAPTMTSNMEYSNLGASPTQQHDTSRNGDLIVILLEEPRGDPLGRRSRDPRNHLPVHVMNAPYLTDAPPSPDIDSVLWSEFFSQVTATYKTGEARAIGVLTIVLMIVSQIYIAIKYVGGDRGDWLNMALLVMMCITFGFFYPMVFLLSRRQLSQKKLVVDRFESRFAALGMELHHEIVNSGGLSYIRLCKKRSMEMSDHNALV